MLELNKIYIGNALDVLKTFEPESIDCVITSPPYWSLRTYKSDPCIWGGDEKCEHRWELNNSKLHSGRGDIKDLKYSQNESIPDTPFQHAFCSLCGCWKGELGLEPTFDLYIQHLVSIFDEVKRVLKKEGSCWVNLGDSFGGSNQGYGAKTKSETGIQDVNDGYYASSEKAVPQAKIFPKSRLLIPERFAIVMQERGWVVRQEIIWVKQILDVKESKTKGSAMPTSVKDRFNCTHEKLYHFTRNTEPLWWTNSVTGELVKIQPKGTHGEEGTDWEWQNCPECQGTGKKLIEPAIDEENKEVYSKSNRYRLRLKNQKIPGLEKCDNKRCVNGQRKSSLWEGHDVYFNLDAVRLKNQVVGVTDFRTLQDFQSYNLKKKEESFSPQGKQSWERPNYAGKFRGNENPEAFGSPRARTQRSQHRQENYDGRFNSGNHPSGKNLPSVWLISPEPTKEKHFAAYPTKLCHIPILTTCPPGGIVLDPFCGTNTTGKVAEKLGRSWIGIDIQENYKAIAKRKLAQKEMGLI